MSQTLQPLERSSWHLARAREEKTKRSLVHEITQSDILDAIAYDCLIVFSKRRIYLWRGIEYTP